MKLYQVKVVARKDGAQGIGKWETFNLVAEDESELKKILLAALKVCSLEYLSGWSVVELDIDQMARRVAMDLLKQVQVFNSPKACKESCRRGNRVISMFSEFSPYELDSMREEDRTFDQWCNLFFEVEWNLKKIAWPAIAIINK